MGISMKDLKTPSFGTPNDPTEGWVNPVAEHAEPWQQFGQDLINAPGDAVRGYVNNYGTDMHNPFLIPGYDKLWDAGANRIFGRDTAAAQPA